MRRMIQFFGVAGLACLLAGCETVGMSSRERAGVTYPEYIFSLRPNTNAAVHRELAVPLRLAVAQVGEVAPSAAMLARLETNHSLVAFATGLPMPGMAEGENASTRLQSLRRLAQAEGADYVFIFGGNIDSWRQGNELTFLNATLIGGAIVPGTSIKAQGKAAGALIEAATGEPALFASADEQKSGITPSLLADGKLDSLRAAMRDKLAVALADDLLRRIAVQTLLVKSQTAASERTQTR